MKNKILLVATAITAFTAGFGAGAVGGFKAAVTDYVENDAQRIESQAVEMYDLLEKAEPAEVEESTEETGSPTGEPVESNGGENGSRGFQ